MTHGFWFEIGLCSAAGEQPSQACAIRARASTSTSTGAFSCGFPFPLDIYRHFDFFFSL